MSAAQSSQPTEQMPPGAPDVSYRDGQLKIVAHNSTLRDVLQSIRTRTGAIMEGPVDAASERVAVQLGPAPVQEVLSKLLQGSRFDYVILNSAAKPSNVEHIILSFRQGRPSPPQPSARSYEPPEEVPEEEPLVETGPPGSQPQFPGQVLPGSMPPDMNSAGQPVPPEGMRPLPPDQMPGPSQPNSSGEQQPKSPEQLLRELQMMQQREQNQGADPNR
jgi:hypothetical protein